MKKEDILSEPPKDFATTLELRWFQDRESGKTFLCQKHISAENPLDEGLDVWVAIPIEEL